jgi:hypothetical protein
MKIWTAYQQSHMGGASTYCFGVASGWPPLLGPAPLDEPVGAARSSLAPSRFKAFFKD